ncbi:MAG: histidinol phosphatase [Chitinophagaceae bacterium]
MFSFFKTKKVKPDLSFIGVDMHSHLLPGLDDGLQETEDTIRFIGELQELGYEKLICTPHTLAEVHPNSPLTILPKLKEVRDALKKQHIRFPIDAASEYMTDMSLGEKIAQDYPLLTFGKNHQYILIEMSYLAESSNIENVIFGLQAKGLQPILAHPERYNYYHGDLKRYHRMKELGCLMQSNLLSFLGYYGKPTQVTVEKLAKEKLIDLLGTDIHHDRHLRALKELASKPSFYKTVEHLDIQNRPLFLDDGKESVSTEIPTYFNQNRAV